MKLQRHAVLLVGASIALLAGCGGNTAQDGATNRPAPSAAGDAGTSRGATSQPSGGRAPGSAGSSPGTANSTSGTSGGTGSADAGELAGLECPVDEGVVGEAVGVPIVQTDPAVGGVGSTAGFSFAYSGCRYTTDDGAEFTVAAIVDEHGEPTVAPITAMGEALAKDPGPDVGDEAFFTRRGALVVSADGRSFSFEIDRAHLEDEDLPLVIAMARAVVSSGASDPAGWCGALAANVPDQWQPTNTDRPQQGEGTSGGVGYRSCRVTIAAVQGASVLMKVSEGSDMFDELAADLAAFDDRAPQAVPGVGDEAYRYGDEQHLVVRVGDRGIVLQGQGSDGEPAAHEVVTALATAVLAAT